MERSFSAQCILLLPPLVTRANSRDASVFSIFLLMDTTSVDQSLVSVHLAGECDVHLPGETDVHLPCLSYHCPSSPLKVSNHVPMTNG
jgi:hypothetical protein